MLLVILLCCLSSQALCSAAQEAPKSDVAHEANFDACFDLLKAAGASDMFGSFVGHAIHSLTVRGLQKFEPNATEINFIPTINMDLAADEAILEHAPDRRSPSDQHFMTDGIKTLDDVLSHIDEHLYDIRFYGPLERIAHAFHMEESWAHMKKEYDRIKANPPNNTICECAMDIENNGVLKMLRFSAMGIREPQLLYGNKPGLKQGYEVYAQYTYNFFLKKDFLRDKAKELAPEMILLTADNAMPELNSTEAWNKWKHIHHSMPKESHSNPALFIYCALNKAGTI